MQRFLVFVDGVAGWIECRAGCKNGARVYACEYLGLRALPRRHCVVPVAE